MYVIKVHYEATNINPNFKGEIKDYYKGIKESTLSVDEMPKEWLIKKYGYKKLCGARKALKTVQENAKHESEYGYWNVSAELVEI